MLGAFLEGAGGCAGPWWKADGLSISSATLIENKVTISHGNYYSTPIVRRKRISQLYFLGAWCKGNGFFTCKLMLSFLRPISTTVLGWLALAQPSLQPMTPRHHLPQTLVKPTSSLGTNELVLRGGEESSAISEWPRNTSLKKITEGKKNLCMTKSYKVSLLLHQHISKYILQIYIMWKRSDSENLFLFLIWKTIEKSNTVLNWPNYKFQVKFFKSSEKNHTLIFFMELKLTVNW